MGNLQKGPTEQSFLLYYQTRQYRKCYTKYSAYILIDDALLCAYLSTMFVNLINVKLICSRLEFSPTIFISAAVDDGATGKRDSVENLRDAPRPTRDI